MTALVDDLLLTNPAWMGPAVSANFRSFRSIALRPTSHSTRTAFGLGYAVYPSTYRATAERIRAAGFEAVRLDISELANVEAGLTRLCAVVPEAR